MFSFALSLRAISAAGVAAIALAACGGGSSGSTSSVPNTGATAAPTTPGVVPGAQPTVQPSPSGSTASAADFVCPTSDTATYAARSGSVAGDAVRRAPLRHGAASGALPATTQLLAVTYDARVLAAQKTVLANRESALGTTPIRSFAFTHAGLVTHVLAVPAASVTSVSAALRQSAGVKSVGLTGTRRFAAAVTQPYYPNDPYFTGFSTTTPVTTGGAAPAATYKVVPLEESADVPGQWDMHVERLEYAFGYSQADNGSGITAPAALGSSAVKIAIIDTGEDTTHPELHSKIAYQRCYITNPTSNAQSTSTFTTDPDGHGTDVAGIAGAAGNNGLGFTGAGGNVQLYGYRVFPTPDDSCAKEDATGSQCTTNTLDIASAIADAVSNHVNVISLSLGGSPCTNGADPDPTEGAAIAEAIAANIIVVAAAGNSSGPPVEAPACDPGVIAVGATAIADGQTNGSNKSGGSATSPFEYVASYTDYGSPGEQPGNSAAWGIVAPGGDPTSDPTTGSSTDSDDLHWIENIWTSTPFAANASDTSFAGNCSGDYPTQSGTVDCRVLIAGTSMATPHVAGAAALIISVNPSYQSPALMKQLLCTSADDIGDPNEGCGRLDVYRAVASAVGDTSPPAANPIP